MDFKQIATFQKVRVKQERKGSDKMHIDADKGTHKRI